MASHYSDRVQGHLLPSAAIPNVENKFMKSNALRFLSAFTLAAAATTGSAQTAPAGTVEAKDVKTWIITVDGKQYEARPLTPTFKGDTGLFHLPSAYTVAKGKSAFSIYRMN